MAFINLDGALLSSRGALVAAFTFSGFINALMLVSPLYMMQIYNRVLPHRSEETLVALTMLVAGLLGVMVLLDALRGQILARIGNRLDSQLRSRVADAVIVATIDEKQQKAEHALHDLDTLRGFVTGNRLVSFFDIPFAPLFLALLFVFHPLLGTIALIGGLVLLMIAVLNDRLTRGELNATRVLGANARSFFSGSLRNAETMEAMGIFPSVSRRWNQLREAMLSRQTTVNDRVSIMTALTKTVRLWQQTAMLGTGAYLAINDVISPGTIIAASVLMGRAVAPIEQIVEGWKPIVEAYWACHRINGLLLNCAPRPRSTTHSRSTNELIVEGVTVALPRSTSPILRGVTFSVAAGKVVGVVGPSGAGKSVLAKTLAGAWYPQLGTVRLQGANVHTLPDRARLECIGYLPEAPEFFDGTIAENIARLSPHDDKELVLAANRGGAHRFIQALPRCYDTPIGPIGHTITRGQCQRIALARAFYGTPNLIVLDQPNTCLDADGESALIETLDTLRSSGAIVVIVSQSSSIIRHTDYVMVLVNGVIRAFAPPNELRAPPHRACIEARQPRPGAGVAPIATRKAS